MHQRLRQEVQRWKTPKQGLAWYAQRKAWVKSTRKLWAQRVNRHNTRSRILPPEQRKLVVSPTPDVPVVNKRRSDSLVVYVPTAVLRSQTAKAGALVTISVKPQIPKGKLRRPPQAIVWFPKNRAVLACKQHVNTK